MPHFQIAQSTDYRDLLDDLRDFVSSDHVDTLAIVSGGAGYTLGDILTVAGGTFFVASTMEVTGEAAGVITAVEIRQSGGYTVNPATPNSPTGGTGAGASITLTFSGILWTVNRDDQSAAHDSSETELQIQGVGSGADEIYVGIRSYFNVGGDARNWELAGFTGFTGANTWENQPGKSPGRFDSSTGTAVVPLANATIDYWFNVDGRRIIVVTKIGTSFSSAYLGFLNQFATDTEFPYPLYIAGSSSRIEQRFSDTFIGYSGISDPIREDDDASDVGPAFFRFTDGLWTSVFNSDMTGASRSVQTGAIVHPSGNPVSPIGDENRWYSAFTQNDFSQFIPSGGVPGVPTDIWAPTPDTGGDIYPTWPCTVMLRTGTQQIIGELDDVRWFPAAIGPVVAEDTLDGDRFTVFQCGNRSEPWAHFVMRTRN